MIKQSEFENASILRRPLVRGDDLIAFGLKTGQNLGEILEAGKRSRSRGGLAPREEALAWVKKEYSLG